MVLPLLLVEVFCRALSVLVAKKWSNFRLLLIFVEMLGWFWLVIGCQKIEVIFFFFWFLLLVLGCHKFENLIFFFFWFFRCSVGFGCRCSSCPIDSQDTEVRNCPMIQKEKIEAKRKRKSRQDWQEIDEGIYWSYSNFSFRQKVDKFWSVSLVFPSGW